MPLAPRLPSCATAEALTVAARHCSTHKEQTQETVIPDEVIIDGEKAAPEETAPPEDKATMTNDEKAKGSSTTHEFQAETRQLLDIVARSLYSEKEVFIRELISNASDAVEKSRYLSMLGGGTETGIIGGSSGEVGMVDPSRDLKIEIATDKVARTLTIADSGIGMTKEEMVQNLGTIARSGSKAFVKEIMAKEGAAPDPKDIIGQFGVGFYSAFMVADKIEVYSRASKEGQDVAYRWMSDGSGTFEIAEAEGVSPGTKIIVHLKKDCSEFADETVVRDVIKKYSSFVGCPVNLNGAKSNELRPVWLMDPKEVTLELHEDFYRYISNSFDKPRFIQHFRADAPLDIRALFYVPESRPGLFETQREAAGGGGGGETGVALYCRKILIKSKVENIVPRWMRFVKGVVDSEDIPLNLSRELLQDSAQIRKLRTVVSNKFLRFIQERARKERKSFLDFYKDYSFFFKEGILMSQEQYEKEEIAKVLRFESSKQPAGELTSLPEYCDRMKAGQRDVFYLSAPSRQLAESSPYFEALKKKDDVEVIFCYESYDELVLMQLQQFDQKKMTSVEKDMRETADATEDKEGSLSSSEQSDLTDWMKSQLGMKAAKVRTTRKLESHPCVIMLEEMAAARHFIKTQGANFNEEQRYNILQPQFEINPSNPIIKKVNELRESNPKLASLVTEQLFANAMVSAGLVEDPRTILRSMNEMLEAALEKH